MKIPQTLAYRQIVCRHLCAWRNLLHLRKHYFILVWTESSSYVCTALTEVLVVFQSNNAVGDQLLPQNNTPNQYSSLLSLNSATVHENVNMQG